MQNEKIKNRPFISTEELGTAPWPNFNRLVFPAAAALWAHNLRDGANGERFLEENGWTAVVVLLEDVPAGLCVFGRALGGVSSGEADEGGIGFPAFFVAPGPFAPELRRALLEGVLERLVESRARCSGTAALGPATRGPAARGPAAKGATAATRGPAISLDCS